MEEKETKLPEPVFSYPQEAIDELRREAVEKTKRAKHEWRQRGSWVYCKSCEAEHGFFVGVGKMLVGLDADGNPKLVGLHPAK